MILHRYISEYSAVSEPKEIQRFSKMTTDVPYASDST